MYAVLQIPVSIWFMDAELLHGFLRSLLRRLKRISERAFLALVTTKSLRSMLGIQIVRMRPRISLIINRPQTPYVNAEIKISPLSWYTQVSNPQTPDPAESRKKSLPDGAPLPLGLMLQSTVSCQGRRRRELRDRRPEVL